ncbi:hypothetical protein MA03_06435 [Infirmifilum uzonense]|uniref:Uncharacterized protein n=2 Tax=Infirmifilum uzonense TaxID=1550241 RepID=A0A0F7FID6_9CREN|nr:hypothetical protein MA03_06435 [Infirmifilum uzonense]
MVSSRASSPGLSPLYSFFLEKDVGAIQAFQVDHARRAWYALTEAVEEVSLRRTRIASLRAYADILPEYRKTLDSIDAMLRELEELRSRIEGLLDE